MHTGHNAEGSMLSTNRGCKVSMSKLNMQWIMIQCNATEMQYGRVLCHYSPHRPFVSHGDESRQCTDYCGQDLYFAAEDDPHLLHVPEQASHRHLHV